MVITVQELNFWKYIPYIFKAPRGKLQTELMKKLNQYQNQ